MLGDHRPKRPPESRFARLARVGGACVAEHGAACRTCAEHCEPHAILLQQLPHGRSRPVILDARCNACGECVRVCPAQAMALRVVAIAPR